MQVEGQRGGSLLPLAATGARVRNAYPTCPCPGDSLAKARIIPGVATVSHGIVAIGPPDNRGSERKVPHIGTETRSKLLREAAVRNIGQWARA